MKTIALVFLMLAVPAAVLAQKPLPPAASGEPETVYSYSERVRDNELVQRFMHSLMRPSSILQDQFAKWKRPICVNVAGMAFADAYFVEQRIREVAQKIGASPDQNNRCLPNILVFVTPEPQALLDSLVEKHPLLFAASSPGEHKAHYPIQAWYFVTDRDYNGHESPDVPWNEYMDSPTFLSANNTRLQTGIQPELRIATIVVDSAAIKDVTLDSLADYIALMSLAQAPAAGRCQPAASIANLFLTGCEADFHTAGLTDIDLAMLTSLYQTPDQPERVQLTRLLNNMRRNLEATGKR